jgi:hypothetical protein
VNPTHLLRIDRDAGKLHAPGYSFKNSASQSRTSWTT